MHDLKTKSWRNFHTSQGLSRGDQDSGHEILYLIFFIMFDLSRL